MSPKPTYFGSSRPHPADAKALADLWAEFAKVCMRLPDGRHAELTVSRQRGNGRLTGCITERRFPLEDQITEGT